MKTTILPLIVIPILVVAVVSCKKETSRAQHQDGPEPTSGDFIDLGLAVKWASCNIGASRPYSYGDYYAWAELQTYYHNEDEGQGQQEYPIWKDEYKVKGYVDENNRLYIETQQHKGYNKYTPSDKLTALEPVDDVAVLSGKGRIPTADEFAALVKDCRWEWGWCHGIPGYYVYGKKDGYTGKCIFLPAAGFRSAQQLFSFETDGAYWTASADYGVAENAESYFLNEQNRASVKILRGFGLSVRPVKND